MRTIHGALTILAKVSKAGDEHLRLRDLLFPEGLRLINKSHSAEAGHAAALASAMTPEVLARMKAIPIGDTTLVDLYTQYQDTAKQLGAVDEKRARLNRPSVTPAAQVLAACREWIRWANILLTTAENMSPATDALHLPPARSRTESRLALALERGTCGGAGAGACASSSQVNSERKGHGRPEGWAAVSRF